MSIVSTCPKCHEQVTIPDGLEPEAEVRCPLCAVVYPLREALAEAPPALIPVETGAIEGPRPDSDALATSDLISERFHVGESADVSGPPGIDAAVTVEPSPAIDTGRTAFDADALAAFRVEESEDRPEPADRDLPTRPRKKKKEKGAIRFMVEVFGGGILGLLMGYYVLCWVLGSQHGLPELPLPLLPHTMHWFAREPKVDHGGEEPSPDGDLGVTHLKGGEFDEAIAQFTKEIRLDPADATMRANRAGAYLAKGEFQKAIEDYNEAIRLNPELAGAYHGRGVAHNCNSEPDRAIADFNEAVRIDPEYAEAYCGRGDAYAEKGEFERAIADYDEAIRLNPTDYAPYVNRGKTYEQHGDQPKAEADYAKARELGYVPK